MAVRCNDEGEAQRRRWTFYEAINVGMLEKWNGGTERQNGRLEGWENGMMGTEGKEEGMME